MPNKQEFKNEGKLAFTNSLPRQINFLTENASPFSVFLFNLSYILDKYYYI